MIPEVALDNDAGRVRVIAGDFSGVRGPAPHASPNSMSGTCA